MTVAFCLLSVRVLGVGDVESSFWELETFLNSETYETLILGAALQLFQKRGFERRKLGLEVGERECRCWQAI